MSSRSEDDIDLLSGKCIGHGLRLPRPGHEDARLIPPAPRLPQRASEESSETQWEGHDARKRYYTDVSTGVRFAVMLAEVLVCRLEPRSEERRVGKEGRCRWAGESEERTSI